MHDTTQVTFRVPLFLIERLKAEAKRLTRETRRQITYTSLIRDASYKQFPITDGELTAQPSIMFTK